MLLREWEWPVSLKEPLGLNPFSYPVQPCSICTAGNDPFGVVRTHLRSNNAVAAVGRPHHSCITSV